MLSVVSLVVGFVLLVWGADRFVEGASGLAKKLGIPALIIGLTVVAFGTSAPELAVSFLAGLKGANEIAIGNVLGSNIFNLLAVVGCSAIVSPLVIEKELLNRDWVASIIATFLLGQLLWVGKDLSRVDAAILLVGFVMILLLQIYQGFHVKSLQEGVLDKELEDEKLLVRGHSNTVENLQNFKCSTVIKHKDEMSDETIITFEKNNIKVFLFIIIGFVCIVVGGQFAVNGATEIARMLHISETIIGLTIVAIGTSLPELVTSIVATKRGENSIAIGNVIGSNLFNILFILGLSAVCNPIDIQETAIYDTVLLFVISISMFWIAKKGQFNRGIGIGMVCIYIGYTIWIVVR